MTEGDLFKEHVRSIVAQARTAMQECGYDQLVIHAGTPAIYAFDDQEVHFRTLPHFRRFVPIESAHHLIAITATSVQVILLMPTDYWEERGGDDTSWQAEYDVVEVPLLIDGSNPRNFVAVGDVAWSKVSMTKSTTFVGDESSIFYAQKHGIAPDACNNDTLLSKLDASRCIKTEYELHCIDAANKRSAPAHTAARDAFHSGASEIEINAAFVTAGSSTEVDLAYRSIIALNEKGATLHYMRKRLDIRNGHSFLIDAAAQYRGYAADITRTYASSNASPLFASLISGMDALQQKIVALVKPDVHFIELHHEAHKAIAMLLKEHGVITNDSDDVIQQGVTRAFLPHGLGHMLGLQVHDVGNATEEGMNHPLRTLYPKLRTNLKLKENVVTTIEPGIYFNDILLAPHRAAETKKFFNWAVVDELMPYGGIRIEDNIIVTVDGHKNLTREYLP